MLESLGTGRRRESEFREMVSAFERFGTKQVMKVRTKWMVDRFAQRDVQRTDQIIRRIDLVRRINACLQARSNLESRKNRIQQCGDPSTNPILL